MNVTERKQCLRAEVTAKFKARIANCTTADSLLDMRDWYSNLLWETIDSLVDESERASCDLAQIAELLDGVFEPLPKGGDEGDRTFTEAAYIIAMGDRLCPYHRDSLTWDACTEGYEGCMLAD